MVQRKARPPAKRTAKWAMKPAIKRQAVAAKERAPQRRPTFPGATSAGETHVIERALAAFAHDVRTPLTGIMALSELLSTSELGERERRWVAALKSSADHLVALTTLVVDAARAAVQGIVLRNEVFDLRPFIDQIAESLSVRSMTKGLRVATDIADALPATVVGDPVRLRTAIENLIDNAVKFTQEGTVGLAVSARAVRGKKVRLAVAVSDSGIGMTAAEAKRLFRPFAQASEEVARKFGGAGLGLVLVKRLAQAMGGNLKLDSKPGRGSTFTLSVVLGVAPARSGRGADAPDAQTAPERPRRILCAEDNPYGRVILGTILKELGHSVDFVGTGDAAVSAVAGGGYDLVLMDVTLPGGSGLDATRRIRALAEPVAGVPVIGVSGLSSPAEEASARTAGMNDYLAKPVSPARLAKAIAAAG